MKVFSLKKANPVVRAMDNLRISKNASEHKIKEKLFNVFRQYVKKQVPDSKKFDNFLTLIPLIRQKLGKEALNFTYDEFPHSLLHYAMLLRNLEIIKALIQQGCDPRIEVLHGVGRLAVMRSHINIGLIDIQPGNLAGMMWYYGEQFYSEEEKKRLLRPWVAQYNKYASIGRIEEMEATYRSLCEEPQSKVMSSSRDAIAFQRHDSHISALIENPLSANKDS